LGNWEFLNGGIMAIAHVTDGQMQDYLDGNLSPERVLVFEGHIETCQQCQSELAQYRSLYSELETDVAVELSPDFSTSVMKTIRAEAKKALLARLWNLLLPIIGIGIGIGVMIYYVDFKPLAKAFSDSLNPSRYFDSTVLTNLNEVLGRFHVNLNLVMFAGLSLLVVILIDQLISRHKEKFFSYLKMLPVF
jgi:hypothetical protein